MALQDIIPLILVAVSCAIFGACALFILQRIKLTHFKKIAEELVTNAEKECDSKKNQLELTLKKLQIEQQKEFEVRLSLERRKIQSEEERLKKREDAIESRMHLIEKKIVDIERKEAVFLRKKEQVEEESKAAQEMQKTLRDSIEKVAGLTSQEAKDQLLLQINQEIKQDSANLIRRTLKEAKENAENEARRIVITAINRLAVPCVSEYTTHTVSIPSDEMKGRVIGKEGRNIRTLEKATGVSFIIDDTPQAIVISGLDPTRIAIAKMALSDLVRDGRIHPTSIEEAVTKAQQNIQKLLRQYGEEAALKASAIDLHPELILLLGKLKFRYSYGQNILEHSLEVSHLMGLMASELGLDTRLARRIGLLHDMGKAVSHEMEGTHALIGQTLALKYGESKEVANGIGCHHGEIDALTPEGSLCSAADAISASRQGARSEAVDQYIQRIKRLEDIALTYPGVEKVFAMQAGREVRVVVIPDQVDDDGVVTLARNISRHIESELTYPGKIKITVIREKRVVEYAV